MGISPQFDKDTILADSLPSAVLVREQLRRLVAHSLFTNSKRYPVLLAYTVEQTLLGNAGDLKERTIGVEAFGREPIYDVSLDPVVRTTAAEVRKRLIQYYYNSDHAGEVVIELPLGSYVPSFREPAAPHQSSLQESLDVQKIESSSDDSASSAALAETGISSPGMTFRQWIWIASGLVFAILLGFGAGRIRFPKQPTNMERFWEPITATSNRITYCL